MLTISATRDVSAPRGPVGNLKTVLRAFGDGRTFGELYGDGPTAVVWLHGWGRSGRDFAAAAAQLAADGVASVALDLPGFGASPPLERAGGARRYAESVAAVLAEFEAPVVLVGHSFGGCVATVVAAEHPELVRALVLTGAPLIRRPSARRPPWRFRVVRALHARGLVGERPMEAARQKYGSADYRAARGVMREVLVISLGESLEAEMARVNVPVWLLWGANDHEAPLRIAEESRHLFGRGAALRVVEGVAHWIPTEAPHELVSSVREALA
jgi:pimeloyl-ACP methyl ester carboxylesterase